MTTIFDFWPQMCIYICNTHSPPHTLIGMHAWSVCVCMHVCEGAQVSQRHWIPMDMVLQVLTAWFRCWELKLQSPGGAVYALNCWTISIMACCLHFYSSRLHFPPYSSKTSLQIWGNCGNNLWLHCYYLLQTFHDACFCLSPMQRKP